jgi:succinyl-diaminopimelate desuccinylase
VSTSPDRALAQHPALGEEFLAQVLASLVRTPSVNPDTSEAAVAGVVEDWLAPLGIELQRVEFAPGRASIGARLAGTGDGPTLVLNGHLDTVPIDDRSRWTSDPFGGEIKDGFLYGRGACDMKGGLAVAIGVAHALAERPEPLAGSLVLHFAAGEERGEPGTLSLLEAGFTGDYGITLEPTELKIATATRGAAFMRLLINGRSIHASRARFGLNPIGLLAPVLGVVDTYDRELSERAHPLLPGGSCTPTTVKGGVKENAVPDSVVVTLDRRLLPHEAAADDLEELRGRLAALSSEFELTFELEHMLPPIEGAEIEPDSPFVRHLADVAKRHTGVLPEVYGSPFGSDVRNLVRDAGIEALTFGPGNVMETHCADERIEVRQLRDAAVIVRTFAEELLAGDQIRSDAGGDQTDAVSRS